MVDKEFVERASRSVQGWARRIFWPRESYVRVSNGATSADKPIILDKTGKLDASLLDGEDIADVVGAMVAGNTETGITVTYEDADNTLDFVVSDEFIADTVGAMFSGNTETGITATYQDADNTIDLELSDEYLQDVTGAMVTGNTETGIAVTYDDTNGKLNFDAQTAGDARYVALTGDQTVAGAKTFSTSLSTPTLTVTDTLLFGSGRFKRFASVDVSAGQTWTIDITMAAARNIAIVEIDLTLGANAANTWGILSKRVTFRADATVGNNATIGTTTDFGTASGSNVTITGPTAIADGIRFTIATSASTTSSWNNALIRVVGRQSNLTISSGVA